MYLRLFKPLLDFFLAIVLLVLVSPVLIVAMIGLSIVNRGKVFFMQDRPGRNGQIFKIIKLRTMNDLKNDEGILLPDDVRVTKIGKFIRKTSIDEIPQLINVIKGDMSLVGSRPLLVDYLPLYNKTQRRRHEVKPGITGWAQVKGRNAISWEQKFAYDLWYVDHVSFLVDLKILVLTLYKTLKSEGINNGESVSISKFAGSK